MIYWLMATHIQRRGHRKRHFHVMEVNRHPHNSLRNKDWDVELAADQPWDALVIGSGLAGMTVALQIADRGGSVLMLEKESYLGGNSNKASSGINAARSPEDWESFQNDTIQSAGAAARPDLIEILVKQSAKALRWLQLRVGVDLSKTSQLGGHSRKRTHRPKQGMVGATIMQHMERALRRYEEETDRVQILVETRVVELRKNRQGRVHGVIYEKLSPNGDVIESGELKSRNVVLATGGFASDKSPTSFVSQYHPELLPIPATEGSFSTGDGVHLAMQLGASTVDMEKIQIHPTGWVDPSAAASGLAQTEPTVLAAEMLRGVGGILLNPSGQRFCNELGKRDYVTDRMFSHNDQYNQTRKWDPNHEMPQFFLVLSSSAAKDASKHVDMYTHKGLMHKYEGVQSLAEWMGVDVSVVQKTLYEYHEVATNNATDPWGKKYFRGTPSLDDNETFYAGIVSPVLHYCMGGVSIDKEGHVLTSDLFGREKRVPGLYAAGEVSGGVHGNNRLGGNSLLECVVFGSIIGENLPISSPRPRADLVSPFRPRKSQIQLRDISLEELSQHNTQSDCWVALFGIVYDLTSFAERSHPGGSKAIRSLAGVDGTSLFETAHSQDMLETFQYEQIGRLVDSVEKTAPDTQGEEPRRVISEDEMTSHSMSGDLWVAILGNVYDLSDFAHRHPGGASLIHGVAGKDATQDFLQTGTHTKDFLSLVQDKIIGRFSTKPIDSSDRNDEATGVEITVAELEQHSDGDDLWVAILGEVYDLSAFAQVHPGGPSILYDLAGKDGTDHFLAAKHKPAYLERIKNRRIGHLTTQSQTAVG